MSEVSMTEDENQLGKRVGLKIQDAYGIRTLSMGTEEVLMHRKSSIRHWSTLQSSGLDALKSLEHDGT